MRTRTSVLILSTAALMLSVSVNIAGCSGWPNDPPPVSNTRPPPPVLSNTPMTLPPSNDSPSHSVPVAVPVPPPANPIVNANGTESPIPTPVPSHADSRPPPGEVVNLGAAVVGLFNPAVGLLVSLLGNAVLGWFAGQKKKEADDKQVALEHLNDKSTAGLFTDAKDNAGVQKTLEKYVGK